MATTTAPRRSLFRHPQFAKLWTAATVSLFGTQVSQIAIPFIAAVVLQAPPGEVGLLTTIEFLPFLLFTLPAGVWVDRFPRRRILVIGDIGRAVMLASIPLAYSFDVLTIWQLYVVGFVNGIMTVFFDVADQSYLPTILERDQLVDGNAKLQVSLSSAQILGQPFAGGAVALLTAPVAVLIDALSFLGSAGLILSIRERAGRVTNGLRGGLDPAGEADDVAPSPTTAASVAAEAATAPDVNPEGGGEGGPMRTQIADGLRFFLHHRFLASIAASTATSNLCANIMFAIFPVYVYRILELTPDAVGLAGGFGGAGLLLGALTASRLANRIGVGPTIVGALLVSQAGAILVPAAPKELAVPFIASASFIMGLGGVIYNVNQVSLRQAITPDHFLGRMNATMRFLVWGTIPIGSLIGAGLSEVIGVHETVWVGAVLGLLAFLPVLLSPVRSLRAIPTGEQDAVPG